MDAEKLAEIVKKHGMWLRGEVGGERANLQFADLRSANLRSANLRFADLRFADLRSANLRYADLRSANLRFADLRSANLRSANLQFADLRFADLQSADLQSAKNSELVLAQTLITPDGDLIGWKKCDNKERTNYVIVKMLIPKKAKRSNALGRKCRAEYVKVLEVIGAKVGISQHDGKTEYRKGKTVKCDNWCENRLDECAGGIHFYLTRIEAENH